MSNFSHVYLQIKWCPAPGCESAVEFVVGSGSYDVTCSCSYSFCWNVSWAYLSTLLSSFFTRITQVKYYELAL